MWRASRRALRKLCLDRLRRDGRDLSPAEGCCVEGRTRLSLAGRVIRYFVGGFFSFVVFICSEMLDRAQARTTIREVLDRLAESSQQLAAVFWLQHNPKPDRLIFRRA